MTLSFALVLRLRPMRPKIGMEGPTDVVAATEVTRTWTVRDKTSDEVNVDKDLRIPQTESVQYKIMFDQENRVRKLEGLDPTTDDEFRAVLRSKV